MSKCARILYPESTPNPQEETTDVWLTNLQETTAKDAREKWGFDFERGEPVPGHLRYEWSHCNVNKEK